MHIIVNGEKLEVSDSLTILSFLEEKEMNADQVVAAVNDDVVEREHYESTVLSDGDKVDLMSFVGGG